ncbi:MAG: 7TM diverse intracellular signaling domain-containing protein [Raineya sp.]|nr:ATP-binding protein [Raineya sp.]MDW8297091.1 7TM diverse intracellular signaling domain-containing protein [Raineya sp.]
MKKHKLKLFLIIWSIWISWGAEGQVILESEKPNQEIGKYLYWIEDKENNFTIEQVASESFQNRFQPNTQRVFNKGVGNKTYWLRLEIQSKDLLARDWLLYSSYPFLDRVWLYQKNKFGEWEVLKSGILEDFSKRPIKHRYIIFPLEVRDTLVHQIYIKVQSDTPIQFPAYIERGSHFAEPSRLMELYYGIFIGVMSLMFLGSLFYWIYFRDKDYLYYATFLLGAMIFYLSLSGHLFQFLWRENGYWGKIVLGVGIGIWIIGAGLFTKHFLQTFRYFPLGGKLMQIYAYLGIWVAWSVFILPYEIFTIQIIIIGNLGNLVITTIGIICWIRKNAFAKYFAIAWITYVTGTMLLALATTNIIPRTALTTHLGEVSCMFEVIMFALALSYKSRIKSDKMRQDRTRSQQKLLEIQKDITRKLEIRVEERTRLLQQKQEEIEIQNKELKRQREELEASRDQLAEKNRIIEEQNLALKKYNENLEQIVDERTAQLKKANLELANQNTQLEQFAFITAHNLRSPVAQLLGLTSLFNSENPADPVNAEIIQHIRKATLAMQQTLQDLNEILEIRKGKNQKLELMNFAEMIEQVWEDNFKEEKEVDLRLNLQVKEINFVKSYLKSILYNFISNAIKYRHPNRNPIIYISTRETSDEIVLTIQDNGVGIDLKKHRQKLFGLYQRFHLDKEGKGMGLYLCKTQVEALGGRIEVQSEVGIGTKFDIYFRKTPTEDVIQTA